MVSRSHVLALALALAATAAPLPVAHAAAKRGTFAGSLGVKVPKGAQADLRAINRKTGAIAATRSVGRTGRFSVSLTPGAYLMVGTVVTAQRKVVQKRIAVSLKPGQKRRNTKLTAKKRKRRPKARAAYIAERGQVTPGHIAVEIPQVTGATGDADWDVFSRGINDMLMVDVFQASEECGTTTLIEVERREEMLRELEFQQSPYVDPSTRLTRNLIIGDVELRGRIAAAPGNGLHLTVDIIDKASGKSLGSREATLTRDADWGPPLETAGRQLADDLCDLSDVYEVTLAVDGEGRFATHSATGTIASTLRARRNERGRNVWRDTGSLQWAAVAFSTKTECQYIDPVIPAVNWSVTILDAGDGNLQVTWTRDGNDSTTASVDCPPGGPDDPDPPPIPGQPGPSLINTGPESFLVPYAGGQQAVTGVVEDGGDGFFNTGKITVTRAGVG